MRKLAGLVVAGLVVAGPVVSSSASVAAASDKVDVVAGFYPIAWAVQQVGQDRVRVDNLTPAGVEPHDLELTTDERDQIEDAGLVIVMGKGFQPAVEAAAEDRDQNTLELLARLPIDADGKRVEEHEHEAGEDEEHADEDTIDPHVWLDPVLMRDVVQEVTKALVKADRAHAEEYRANAQATIAEIDALDQEYTSGLSQCDRDLIVTAHEAFGRLAERYGLRQQGIAGLSPDAEPSAQRLADLADLARDEGVTTIFTEELVSPRLAKTLAREAGGLETAVLNPIEGLTDEQLDAGEDYLSQMRANLDELEDALGCTPVPDSGS